MAKTHATAMLRQHAHTAERYGQASINMTVKCIVSKFCNLDNLIVTRKFGAFYRDLPARKNFKILKPPRKWHICFFIYIMKKTANERTFHIA